MNITSWMYICTLDKEVSPNLELLISNEKKLIASVDLSEPRVYSKKNSQRKLKSSTNYQF
jgi:hypothetical protein